MTRAHALDGTDPSHVPEIRDWITKSLMPGSRIREIMDAEARRRFAVGAIQPTFGYVEQAGMLTAKLFWVPREEQELIVNAKRVFPDDLSLSEEDVPYPSGFAVFQDPFDGLDGERGGKLDVQIRALRWSPIHIFTDPDDVLCEGPCMDGMSCSSWIYDKTRKGPMWLSLGRSDWGFGQNWKEYFGNPQDHQLASIYEDRLRFMTLWSLMNTQDPPVYRPTRAELRRDARLAPRTEDRLVHVVRWDPHRYVTENARPSDSKLQWRIPVTDFFRRQPYGPGRRLRRWTYIGPHFRGPVDAPLKPAKPTVYKVVSDAE